MFLTVQKVDDSGWKGVWGIGLTRNQGEGRTKLSAGRNRFVLMPMHASECCSRRPLPINLSLASMPRLDGSRVKSESIMADLYFRARPSFVLDLMEAAWSSACLLWIICVENSVLTWYERVSWLFCVRERNWCHFVGTDPHSRVLWGLLYICLHQHIFLPHIFWMNKWIHAGVTRYVRHMHLIC